MTEGAADSGVWISNFLAHKLCTRQLHVQVKFVFPPSTDVKPKQTKAVSETVVDFDEALARLGNVDAFIT